MTDGTENLDGQTIYDPISGEYLADRRLEADFHPVTAIFVDPGTGVIILKRHKADPEPVSPGSPASSRREMLRRCVALLEGVKRTADKHGNSAFARLEGKLPISSLGIGLTYDDLREQTYRAVLESRKAEARILAEADRKYGI